MIHPVELFSRGSHRQVHIRMQQRNGRKSWTTVAGFPEQVPWGWLGYPVIPSISGDDLGMLILMLYLWLLDAIG